MVEQVNVSALIDLDKRRRENDHKRGVLRLETYAAKQGICECFGRALLEWDRVFPPSANTASSYQLLLLFIKLRIMKLAPTDTETNTPFCEQILSQFVVTNAPNSLPFIDESLSSTILSSSREAAVLVKHIETPLISLLVSDHIPFFLKSVAYSNYLKENEKPHMEFGSLERFKSALDELLALTGENKTASTTSTSSTFSTAATTTSTTSTASGDTTKPVTLDSTVSDSGSSSNKANRNSGGDLTASTTTSASSDDAITSPSVSGRLPAGHRPSFIRNTVVGGGERKRPFLFSAHRMSSPSVLPIVSIPSEKSNPESPLLRTSSSSSFTSKKKKKGKTMSATRVPLCLSSPCTVNGELASNTLSRTPLSILEEPKPRVSLPHAVSPLTSTTEPPATASDTKLPSKESTDTTVKPDSNANSNNTIIDNDATNSNIIIDKNNNVSDSSIEEKKMEEDKKEDKKETSHSNADSVITATEEESQPTTTTTPTTPAVRPVTPEVDRLAALRAKVKQLEADIQEQKSRRVTKT